MIIARVRMLVSSETRQKVIDLIHLIIEPTRVQPGCLSCRIYQDVNDEDVLTYEEVWQEQDMLDQHIRSERYENILAAMDLACHSPDISFNTIAHSDGVEVIYAARKVKQASA